MTAPERFADSQIPLAPRAPSIHVSNTAAGNRLRDRYNPAHSLNQVERLPSQTTASRLFGTSFKILSHGQSLAQVLADALEARPRAPREPSADIVVGVKNLPSLADMART
jgi:hypothetical protein